MVSIILWMTWGRYTPLRPPNVKIKENIRKNIFFIFLAKSVQIGLCGNFGYICYICYQNLLPKLLQRFVTFVVTFFYILCSWPFFFTFVIDFYICDHICILYTVYYILCIIHYILYCILYLFVCILLCLSMYPYPLLPVSVWFHSGMDWFVLLIAQQLCSICIIILTNMYCIYCNLIALMLNLCHTLLHAFTRVVPVGRLCYIPHRNFFI